MANSISSTLSHLPSSLTALHLSDCQIDSSALKLILDKLSLSKLELSENRIGDQGALLLSNWCKKQSNLVGLAIERNHIGKKGLESLFLALSGVKSLVHLDISQNNMKDSVDSFVEFLQTPLQLKWLLINEVLVSDIAK
jgi:Ran GTPase-activating protein (RanGAP) involved in mRNA processing and transport